MGKKKGDSLDESGNPYDYIVIIDAGSKGSRANVYRTKQFNPKKVKQKQHSNRDWKEDDVKVTSKSTQEYPEIISMNSKNIKKIKPGIASFVDNPSMLRKKYMGKLLKDVLKYIPKDQVYRTPIFLHGTGGMRLLKPEDQQKILGEICSYISSKFDFYLPDCNSHINSISGEIEGLYSWIGVNYKYGVLNAQTKEREQSFGILDMGGVSSQIALEPNVSNIDSTPGSNDILFKLHLNYQDESMEKNTFNVFSESFLGGMNQIHNKYDELLALQNITTDPCLPKNFVKTVSTLDSTDNDLEVTGTGEFDQCLTSLNSLLTTITTTKSCNLTSSSSSISSCLLSDSMPFLNFNISKFIGINGFYSNLKNFVNYSEFYIKSKQICSTQYTDLLNTESENIERTSELCFKSSWIINVLHNGLGFPRYGIDIEETTESLPTFDDSFKIMDEFSWTLGRAVLYSYYEAAVRQSNDKTSEPMVGFYEPSSQIFHYGAELPGIPPRPEYNSKFHKVDHDDDDHDHDHDKGHDSDDDDDDDDDWDDVLEEHRLWGSLLFLLILLFVGYLMLGKTKRRSIIDAVKRLYNDRFKSRYVAVIDENELNERNQDQRGENDDDDEDEDGDLGVSERRRRSDSFEV